MQNSTAAWIPGVAGQSHTRKINPAGSLTRAALPPRAAPNPLPCSSPLLPCARSLSRSRQSFGSTPGWFGALAPSPENFCSQLSPSSSPSHLGTLFAQTNVQTNALGPTREPPVPAVHGTAIPMPHSAVAHGEGALGLGAGARGRVSIAPGTRLRGGGAERSRGAPGASCPGAGSSWFSAHTKSATGLKSYSQPRPWYDQSSSPAGTTSAPANGSRARLEAAERGALLMTAPTSGDHLHSAD